MRSDEPVTQESAVLAKSRLLFYSAIVNPVARIATYGWTGSLARCGGERSGGLLFLVFAIAVDFVSNRKMRTRIFTERPLRLRDLEGELPSGTGALIIDGRNFDTVWWSRQSFDEDEYLEHVPNSATRVRLPRRLAFALNLHVELANRYPRCSILCISVPL